MVGPMIYRLLGLGRLRRFRFFISNLIKIIVNKIRELREDEQANLACSEATIAALLS
jgi:hypothetical protein